MTAGVLDSTAIIHLFRRNPAAQTWINTMKARSSVTTITWLEVMYGAPGKDGQAKCKAILSQFDLISLTQDDPNWAMQQMEHHRLSDGVGINDCLIASVAHRLQVPLYTHNLKHMQILVGNLAIKPY